MASLVEIVGLEKSYMDLVEQLAKVTNDGEKKFIAELMSIIDKALREKKNA